MSTQKRNVLKNWFRKGLIPTQQQFADAFDSFFHKTEDSVPLNAVEGLKTELDNQKTQIQDYVDKVIDKADKENHVRTVNVSQLDDFFTPSDMFTMIAKGEYHLTGVWKVTHKSGNLDFTVGILEVFFDSMLHCLTQKLTTNAIINDDGTIDNAHEHKVRQYSRMYNLMWSNGTLPDGTSWPLKTWSAWKDMTVADTDNIKDGAVTEAKLAYDAVTEEKIADGAVTQHRIANGAVRTDKIYANAVTRPKIADGAVDTGKIADYAVTEQKIADNAVTEGKIADGAVTETKVSAELLDKLNSAGMSISGTLNLSQAGTAVTMAAVYAALGNNQMRFYLVTDVDGGFKGGSVTAAGAVAKLFGKDALGVSVGDICVIAKLNSLPVYRILPLNDAKAANGDFPGADGLETVWDKTQINKIPAIETTANEARGFGASAYMPSLGESNMNNALQTGVYPWCTLGRPTAATGAFTCIVRKSYNADGGGYYTIEQTAYGRQDELGQVYKRIIFQKSDGSDTQYGEWILVSGGGSSGYEYYLEYNTYNEEQTIKISQEVFIDLRDISLLCNLSLYPCIHVKAVTGYDLYFLGRANYVYSGGGNTDLSWEVVDRSGRRFTLVMYYDGNGNYMAKLSITKP